jgi:hypothetical protein
MKQPPKVYRVHIFGVTFTTKKIWFKKLLEYIGKNSKIDVNIVLNNVEEQVIWRLNQKRTNTSQK